MQRQMRRKDRQLTTEEAMKLLAEAKYGVLSTVNADGTPYGVPVNYILEGNVIYFHSATSGQKLDNMAQNPAVSFVVVGYTEPVAETKSYSTYFESAFVSGKARPVENPAEKKTILFNLTKKYLPAHMDQFEDSVAGNALDRTAVMAIDIDYVTGKAKKKP